VAISQKHILGDTNILIISKSLLVRILIKKAAEKCAKLYNIKSMTVYEILKDKNIEVILNLTIPHPIILCQKSIKCRQACYFKNP
jgi:hypothetical protein